MAQLHTRNIFDKALKLTLPGLRNLVTDKRNCFMTTRINLGLFSRTRTGSSDVAAAQSYDHNMHKVFSFGSSQSSAMSLVCRAQAVTLRTTTALHRSHLDFGISGTTCLRFSTGNQHTGRTRHDAGIGDKRLQFALLATSDGAPLSREPVHGGAQEQEEGGRKDMASNEEAASNGWRLFWSNYSAQREEMSEKLQRYGSAGVLAYGLFNTLYYLGSFLFVWFFVTPSPGGLGFSQAAQRFMKVFTMVWAGSQVTKLLRAGGAVGFAPVVDSGLTWFTTSLNIDRKLAFSMVVGGCFGLLLLLFLVITSLWA